MIDERIVSGIFAMSLLTSGTTSAGDEARLVEAIRSSVDYLDREGDRWLRGEVPMQQGKGCISCHHVGHALWSRHEAQLAGVVADEAATTDFRSRAMAALALGIASVVGPVVPAGDPDPWSGKPRAEVVQLLGEPDKAKTARDGREILTYKFDRIAPEAATHPEVILLHVPGIGVVARVDRSRAPETTEIGPTVYDKDGRPAGGGLTRTTTASKSYDPKTGEVTESPDLLDKPRVTGKVKLQLTLAPDGRVESWSTSGKE